MSSHLLADELSSRLHKDLRSPEHLKLCSASRTIDGVAIFLSYKPLQLRFPYLRYMANSELEEVVNILCKSYPVNNLILIYLASLKYYILKLISF